MNKSAARRRLASVVSALFISAVLPTTVMTAHAQRPSDVPRGVPFQGGSESDVRIVRGLIFAGATGGEGFTVAQGATLCEWTITFTPAFSAPPTVTFTSHTSVQGGPGFAESSANLVLIDDRGGSGLTGGQVRVFILNPVITAICTAQPFDFMAVGPR